MKNDDFKWNEFLNGDPIQKDQEPKTEQSQEYDFSLFMEKEPMDKTVDETAYKVENVATLADDEGNLDDSNLSEDFVIGKDFFIDSTEADDIAIEEPKPPVQVRKKRKKTSTGKSCLVAVVAVGKIHGESPYFLMSRL